MDNLREELEAYGVDMAVTLDRFVDDWDLYVSCLEAFKEETSFADLRAALDKENYTEAFDAAHTLKGVSGNLGMTPLYEVTCSMVETLRSGENEDLEGKYAAIMAQKEAIDKILEGI
ncbi:MAG: Hpt domain-containing protein [Lachnospiraceae bacterium]|nr:Hpt domain-containing protein [Lachnospiraceae bacterium]